MVTVVPLTVHTSGVVEAYVMLVNPDDAVACPAIENGALVPPPTKKFFPVTSLKSIVMVCAAPCEILSIQKDAPEAIPPDASKVPFTNTNR